MPFCIYHLVLTSMFLQKVLKIYRIKQCYQFGSVGWKWSNWAHPIPKSTHLSATLVLILLLANEKKMFTTVTQPAFRIPSNTCVNIVFSSFKLSIFHRSEYHNLLVNHNKMFHKNFDYSIKIILMSVLFSRSYWNIAKNNCIDGKSS